MIAHSGERQGKMLKMQQYTKSSLLVANPTTFIHLPVLRPSIKNFRRIQVVIGSNVEESSTEGPGTLARTIAQN